MTNLTLPTTPGALLGYRKNGLPIRLQAGGSAPTGEPVTTETEPAATAPAPAPGPAAPAAPVAGENVADLPAWAQKIITDTRKEAGDYRTQAKTAAEAAQKDLSDKLAVALGLKPDAASDPAALAAQIAASQQVAQAAARELAVFKAATGIADPAKLLDRNSFTAAISGIDPTDGAALKAAIEAAVTADPSLKTVRAPGASGIEQTGGPGDLGQITEEQLKSMTPEQIVEAQKKGLLKNLLGG